MLQVDADLFLRCVWEVVLWEECLLQAFLVLRISLRAGEIKKRCVLAYYAVELVENAQHPEIASVGEFDCFIFTPVSLDPFIGYSNIIV